jgi:hypothetical protein
MSALPPKADIAEHHRHVRFVPEADIGELFNNLIRLHLRRNVLGVNEAWPTFHNRCHGPTDA